MRNILIVWFLSGLFLASCSSDNDFDIVYPLEYLPAYPGSYWDYSNGTRSLVNADYELHNYFSSIDAEEKTSEKFVPVLDGLYLYEYSISQSSTKYPLKKLLSTSSGESWTINSINSNNLNRLIIAVDSSITISGNVYLTGTDTTINDVIVVVEYLASMGVDNWNLREYYAKNIGLIRREVANPQTGDIAVEKELIRYRISGR